MAPVSDGLQTNVSLRTMIDNRLARLTSVHRPSHRCNETVDTVALFDERHQGGDTALIVTAIFEVSEDEFLKGVNLILQRHQVLDGLVADWATSISDADYGNNDFQGNPPFVRIVDTLQADVLFVLKETVELGMILVESKLGKDKLDVGTNERGVTCKVMGVGAAREGVQWRASLWPAGCPCRPPRMPSLPMVLEHVSSHPV